MTSSTADQALIQQIRAGNEQAWQTCIELYEGRLLAFVESRLRDRAAAEDVVQETFLGFLTALPNFDDSRPIQAFLFTIAAHKLTDLLRKQGRRPTLPLNADSSTASETSGFEPVGRERKASSIARSGEQRSQEAAVIAATLRELITQWKAREEYERLKCIELLFVRGLPNNEVADLLNLTEQAVANHKSFVVRKLKEAGQRLAVEVDWLQLGVADDN